MEPQSILGCANFQSIIPILGIKNNAIATIVVVVVSMVCNLPPVAHKTSSAIEIQSNFFSSKVIGPIS